MQHSIETFDSLARRSIWEPALLRAVPGRCRGALLSHWGTNVVARWGSQALIDLRAEAGLPAEALPDAPASDAWFPAWAQLAVAGWVLHRRLDGDGSALAALIAQDAAKHRDPRGAALLRRVGVTPLFAAVGAAHSQAYDVGTATGGTDRLLAPRRAQVTFAASPLTEEPLWRLLQLIAGGLVAQTAGWEGGWVWGEEVSPGWRLVVTRAAGVAGFAPPP